MNRICIICGARVTNLNPAADTCRPQCTAEKRKRAGRRPLGKCESCGDPYFHSDGSGYCPDCSHALRP